MSIQLPEGFGSAGYTNEAKFKYFKIKDGETLILRILPPMKSLKNSPKGWGRFYGMHYGWNGQNPKDPSKSQFRPFLCLEEKSFKTKPPEVIVRCEACDYLADKKLDLDELKVRHKREKETEQQRP